MLHFNYRIERWVGINVGWSWCGSDVPGHFRNRHYKSERDSSITKVVKLVTWNTWEYTKYNVYCRIILISSYLLPLSIWIQIPIHPLNSHKFITIELGKTILLEFWGKLSTMSSFFCVVWENHGRLWINLEIKAESQLSWTMVTLCNDQIKEKWH